ncbi:hypothetical protein ACFQZE_13960 [Paenibacillus sp. GCM10027627]|uniref:hypothetical protein n=1 Tax=unclassified Paenibacillus TaxID=185978 RepID=UPI00362ECEB3
MNQPKHVVLSAPDEAGRTFMEGLLQAGIPVLGLAHTLEQMVYMQEQGVEQIAMVRQHDGEGDLAPAVPVGRIYLFEKSLPILCQYLLICRSWTAQSVFVIQSVERDKSVPVPTIYRQLGANHVMFTSGARHSFLLRAELEQQEREDGLAYSSL